MNEEKERDFHTFDDQAVEMPAKFPVTVPFSSSVPQLCAELLAFVHQYHQFAKYLTDMAPRIRSAVKRVERKKKGREIVIVHFLFVMKDAADEIQSMAARYSQSQNKTEENELAETEVKSNQKKKVIKNPRQTEGVSLGISELAQLAVNAYYFEKACTCLEEKIAAIADEEIPWGVGHRHDPSSSPSHLSKPLSYDEPAPKMHEARQCFTNVASACGHALLVLLTSEIESYLEKHMKHLSYHPERSTSINEKPQSYVNELIGYVKGIILAKFNYLPYFFQKSAYFLICTRINQYLLNTLISEEHNEANKKLILLNACVYVGVYNLNLDVKAFEEFSRETGITDLDNTFKQLRVLLDLLLSGNKLLDYLDEDVRQKKYSYVLASDLKKILQRFQTKLSLFAGKLPAHIPNLDKKIIKTVLKALENV
ncbi:hypothetical protein RFI_08647 [Reticulomyxa filosa]|uniref:Exocyst complex subunit EXOC6/Sec15 C-terminal domain-containing protein n=1 Tax=Reticulomyxa filosa TaxID=46433 RepID=X6NRZ7_RETFI|nr:hypothetical protein RFI_08647 [Reticulomyxa filosa]|eukprot:ETO28484.1 hypothetical protein RFI_08647 [Reticulomyxa filosa]